MCALLDPEIRQWLDIGAQSLTAIGTVGAVILALYLSSKDRRASLSVEAAISHALKPGQTWSEGIRLVSLKATNTGFATVTVTNFCWRVGIIRKKVLYLTLTPGLEWPTEVPPKTLHSGDWLIVNLLEEQYLCGLFYLMEEVKKHPIPSLAMRSLRAGAETSTNKRFFCRPNWELRKSLRQQFYTSGTSQQESEHLS
jgi:hypothetical protein